MKTFEIWEYFTFSDGEVVICVRYTLDAIDAISAYGKVREEWGMADDYSIHPRYTLRG